MKVKFIRPQLIRDEPFPFCPGCSHGIIHRLLAETIEELKIREKVVGISSIGCSIRSWTLLDIDMCQAAHGRAPTVGTGVKRSSPNSIVFTYQGDGDLVSIGMAELIHAAARGEKITVIFANNANFGMTGGQMAPTTLLNQVTTTSLRGRQAETQGYPIKICELLSSLEGSAYLARGALNSAKNILTAKQYLQQAFLAQLQGKGFSLVELLCTCPTNWRMNAVEACSWVNEEMIPAFPLGIIKDTGGV